MFILLVCFFKQKTAYEMRISDWSSDVCSSDLVVDRYFPDIEGAGSDGWYDTGDIGTIDRFGFLRLTDREKDVIKSGGEWISSIDIENAAVGYPGVRVPARSEEHTSELQSLMRISYAVFCLKKKRINKHKRQA